MKKRDDSADKTDVLELQFPDWSGMDDTAARVSPDTAYQLCEQYCAWSPELAVKWQSQRPPKCLAEFVL